MSDSSQPRGDHGRAITGERRRVGKQRHNFVGVMDQSGYQEVLQRVLTSRGRIVDALLIPELHDAAVAVTIDGQTVGHLGPDVAAQYAPILRATPTPIVVCAELDGGEWDRPSISVALDFSPVYAAAHRRSSR
jgi:hypothetical protein